jgi:hypothetical protein
MSDEHAGAVEQLVCTRCDTNPTVARREDRGSLVCQCTHEDGPLDAIPVNEMAVLPEPWEFVATDGGGRYNCHSVENDVATLLITDPLYNQRLREVLADE